jgi:uracil-DNA glycosylase
MDLRHVHPSWLEPLKGELAAPYMAALRDFLAAQERSGARIFPAADQRFRALELTGLEDVRVVILGQDPYHGAGQAHGLAFSVQPGTRTPPSLANIYKELEADLGIPRARHGFLEHWARQGVLLLNAVLSVEEAKAGAHQGRGWERFTDSVIRLVSDAAQPTVFMLWGSHAQKKAVLVDQERHLVLTATHPSPLSAHRGFLGCRHFSQANAFLRDHGRAPIDWALPSLD